MHAKLEIAGRMPMRSRSWLLGSRSGHVNRYLRYLMVPAARLERCPTCHMPPGALRPCFGDLFPSQTI